MLTRRPASAGLLALAAVSVAGAERQSELYLAVSGEDPVELLRRRAWRVGRRPGCGEVG